MLTSELDFPLPPELIAQEPARPRDSARLLHIVRGAANEPREDWLFHRGVRELPNLLRKGNLLVFNDSRVLRARLHGRRVSGGKVEALLLREWARNEWEVLLKPSARLRVGQEVFFILREMRKLKAKGTPRSSALPYWSGTPKAGAFASRRLKTAIFATGFCSSVKCRFHLI